MLQELRDELAAAGVGPPALRDRLEASIPGKKLALVNALIDTHNAYFPIEANLPIDRETGGFLFGGKRWEKTARLTVDALVGEVLGG